MSRSRARRSPSSSAAPASRTSTLVRRDVTGVRSSCEASATSRRCAAWDTCTRSSMASKRWAMRPTSSSPRAPMRRPRSPVASMCSAARVSSAIGRITGRANRRVIAAAKAIPAATSSTSTIRRRPSAASTLSSERPSCTAPSPPIGTVMTRRCTPSAVRSLRNGRPWPPATARSRLATAIGSPPRRSRTPPSGATTCENSAGPPARRGGAGNAPPAQGADALDQLALGAQAAIDLRAQLAAHGQVTDQRRERDRHAHGQRGHERQAPAQRHGCSRST